MDLISWEVSAAVNIAGLSATSFPWLIGILDTDDPGPLLSAPNSVEAFEYFSQHCIASHLSYAHARSGSSYLPYLSLEFGTTYQGHRGGGMWDGSSVIRATPSKIKFEGSLPNPVSFYQSQYSLLNPQRLMPIVWGTNFMGAKVVQEFDTAIFIREVVYATFNSSAAAQRPAWIRIKYMDANDVWQQGGDIQVNAASVLNPKTLTLNQMCKAVSLEMLTAAAGQTGWSIDTFYCVTDLLRCIPDTARSVVMCPVMYGVATLPANLVWAPTNTPVLMFDMSEVTLNRVTTDMYIPMAAITDRVMLEASVYEV